MTNIQIPYPREFLPKQQEVLDSIKKKKKKYILYSGAYGAGKTLLMCHIIIMQCLKHPRSLWFFGSQTIPMLRDTILRTFLEEIDLYQQKINQTKKSLPKNEQYLLDFRLQKDYKMNTMTFKFFNDSEVLFRSCDEPSKYKSLNLDGFAIDEPVDIDEQVFLMLQGRLRGNHTKHRIGVLAGNPSGRANWVYQTFFEKQYDEYYVVQTTTYDNKYLPRDYIKSCEANFDSDYAKRYLQGEWGSFEGQIYKEFNYEKHIGEFKDQKFKYYIGGYDDGYRNPACFLTIGVDSDNNVYVVNEYYQSEKTVDHILKYILALDGIYHYKKIYADPSAANWIGMAREKHLNVKEADNNIENGISKVKALLYNDLLKIDSSCVNLIKEIESYRYERDKFNRNLTEKPFKKNDHSVDALRYAFTDFNPFRKASMCAGGRW